MLREKDIAKIRKKIMKDQYALSKRERREAMRSGAIDLMYLFIWIGCAVALLFLLTA